MIDVRIEHTHAQEPPPMERHVAPTYVGDKLLERRDIVDVLSVGGQTTDEFRVSLILADDTRTTHSVPESFARIICIKPSDPNWNM